MTEPGPGDPPLWRVHAQVLLSRALVATSFVVGAEITHGLAPELLTLLRFALATLLFLPYVAWRHGLALPSLRALAGYAAISAAIVSFFWAMFEALRWTSALNTAADPVASRLLDRTGVCGARRGTLSQRANATGRASDRQIGPTRRGDQYADCRIRTGFAVDHQIGYATGDANDHPVILDLSPGLTSMRTARGVRGG